MATAPDNTPKPGGETDDRFPSGPWTGYFLQPGSASRNKMEMVLTFRHGSLSAEGCDLIGQFVFNGRYDRETGYCSWIKQYLGMHAVAYQGYNEGRGIWGVWEVSPAWKGGFHIWPLGQGSGDASIAREAVEIPSLIAR